MPSQRRALLERARTIAVVGASNNPVRPSYTVFSYLRRQPGYVVAPINPKIDGIDGIEAFASLAVYATQCGAPGLVRHCNRLGIKHAVLKPDRSCSHGDRFVHDADELAGFAEDVNDVGRPALGRIDC